MATSSTSPAVAPINGDRNFLVQPSRHEDGIRTPCPRDASGRQGVSPSGDIPLWGEAVSQYHAMDTKLKIAHAYAHSAYIQGSIGQPHYSFHDPFVFLLHSNVDRLWATWQRAPGR